MSLLFGAATVPVVFLIGRAAARSGGSSDAGVACNASLAAFYLTSAVTARYALMARPYALCLCFIAIAVWALIEAMSRPPTPQLTRRWSLEFRRGRAGGALYA